MQSYAWQRKYDCIILRWCIGYLNETELESFLRKALLHLRSTEHRVLRRKSPKSFIIVLENVIKEDEYSFIVKGERYRRPS